jgi:hypothetical protein
MQVSKQRVIRDLGMADLIEIGGRLSHARIVLAGGSAQPS